MEIPKWLDVSLVEKVLQNAEKDDSIKVSCVTAEPATIMGINYTSDLRRVIAEFSKTKNGQRITGTRFLIVKLELQNDVIRELIREAGMFEREMSMMMETLPRMNESLCKLGVTLSARCFQVHHKNPMHLIIEDLKSRDFQMAEHTAGLNLDHSLLAIRHIAIFHAASVALMEKDSETTTKYKKNIKGADAEDVFVTYIKRITKALGTEVAKWSELNSRMSEKICKLSETVWEKTCEASLVLEDDFNVLNHGDCTVLNMMFHYNREWKSIFVDFQTTCYGSPAIDILNFFGSSLSADVRLDHRELLISEYHKSLTNVMIELKCSTKVPSLKSLHDTLKKRGFCEVVPSFTALPNVVVDGSEVKAVDKLIVKMDEKGYPGHRGKNYRDIMTRVLPYFDSMGLLDT